MRMPLSFTETQNAIITRSLTAASVLVLFGVVVAGFVIILNGLASLVHVIGPVIVAFFLATLTKPIYEAYLKLLKRDTLAIVAFVLTFALPFACLLTVLIANLWEQLSHLIDKAPQILSFTMDAIKEYVPSLASVVDEYRGQLSTLIEQGLVNWKAVFATLTKGFTLGGVVMSSVVVLTMWAVMPVYWILFVMQPILRGSEMVAKIPYLTEEQCVGIGMRWDQFRELIVSYFRGQILDVSIQAVLYGVAFTLIGLPGGFFIGVMTGYMNLLPYIGSTVALLIALPVALFTGGIYTVVAVLVAFTLVQSLDGYVIQPKIQGDRMQLQAWQIIFALLFWTQVAGFIGLLIAIPLTAFLRSLLEGILDAQRQYRAIGKVDKKGLVCDDR